MMGNAHAQEAPAAEHQLSYNAALTTEYRYRGLSQSRFDPALQGGVDYTHSPTGFYAGTWLSTIKWTKDLGGDGNVEVDLYGGKRGQITDAISYDVGGLYYWYPSNDLRPNANTFELYGQVGFGRTRRPTCSAPPTASRAATWTSAPTYRSPPSKAWC
jgi:uncharacterized protein (TIGR02001 family)